MADGIFRGISNTLTTRYRQWPSQTLDWHSSLSCPVDAGCSGWWVLLLSDTAGPTKKPRLFAKCKLVWPDADIRPDSKNDRFWWGNDQNMRWLGYEQWRQGDACFWAGMALASGGAGCVSSGDNVFWLGVYFGAGPWLGLSIACPPKVEKLRKELFYYSHQIFSVNRMPRIRIARITSAELNQSGFFWFMVLPFRTLKRSRTHAIEYYKLPLGRVTGSMPVSKRILRGTVKTVWNLSKEWVASASCTRLVPLYTYSW